MSSEFLGTFNTPRLGNSAAVLRILEVRNLALERELNEILRLIRGAKIPSMLEEHREAVLRFGLGCQTLITRNIRDLRRGFNELLEDLRSSTAQVLQRVRLLSRHLSGPILRCNEADNLSLRIIRWMHRTDPLTTSMPAAFQDGDPAVLPFLLFAPLYYFPSCALRGLRHQPLFFHEFGHVIYQRRQPEMDDLVAGLQRSIEDSLRPMSSRNDEHSKAQAQLTRTIVSTWYSWAQEFFCDALGLAMVGPAYIYAFADYCGRLERGDFAKRPVDLHYSTHPITWLRIKMLVRRARQLGFKEAADLVESEWNSLSTMLDINEDYFGYFENSWGDALHETLDDMLMEVGARECSSEEAICEREWQEGDSPVYLLNRAWRVALSDHDNYLDWEDKNRDRFLASTEH